MDTIFKGAYVQREQYSHGEAFYQARCDECHVMFNSGHHYPPEYIWAAQELADKHNALRHQESF